MNKTARIFVAGHTGLVGSAVLWQLEKEGFPNIILRTHAELNLTRQADVEAFFKQERPEYVFLCAARVGGILANSAYPAEFGYENLMIAANVISSARRFNVKKLLNLGSSCIYPRNAPQPLKEDYLLTGTLEPTNEAYAVAKIAAIKLCRYFNIQYGCDFLSVMPTNLYGPHDNFDLETSHVLPALLRKFHEAKTTGAAFVEIWGTGSPIREFLHVDDLAEALIFIMKNYDASAIGEFVNIGTGKGVTIKELGQIIAEIVGFSGEIRWDAARPDGMPVKVMDVSRIKALGWKASIGLKEGIEKTYQWYKENR